MLSIDLANDGNTPDLAGAAAEYFSLNSLITLAVALLVSSIAYVVMHLYMRAISQESRRSSPPSQPSPALDAATQFPPAPRKIPLEIQTEKPTDALASQTYWHSAIFRHADTAFHRAACFYTLGGLIHTTTSVCLLFVFGFYPLQDTLSQLTMLACYAGVFWSWSFITIFALVLFWGPNSYFRWQLMLAYVAMIPLMGLLLQFAGAPSLAFSDIELMPKDQAKMILTFTDAITGQSITADAVTFSPLLQPLVFWSLSAAPVIIPFLVFNRFIRATVGPLFINLALAMLLSAFCLVDLILYTSPGVWLASLIKELFANSTYKVLMTFSLTLSAIVAWFWLLWIVHSYRSGQLSDQTFLLDSLWLASSLVVSTFLMGHNAHWVYLLGLLPFILYKITVGYGLKSLSPLAQHMPRIRLLFLRVFGSPSRSEQLFDFLAAHWRYAGSIQLIGATDMARSRFEPDELLDFLSGKLTNTYIRTSADLDQHLAELEFRPTPDGRYRVNEFFCCDDTWQETVTRLMEQSNFVIMDLRGFTSERKGCIFELGALFDTVPLKRVVALIDQTTDEPLLKQTLAHWCQSMNPKSPNASKEIVRIRMIDLACGYPAAVHRLMQICDELIAYTEATHLAR